MLEALAYAKSLAPNHLVAVTVVADEEEQERIEKAWSERRLDIPLEIVHSPYRELARPVMRFIDELDARYENDIITVVLPEFVVTSLVGAPAPQPERAVPQGPAAVPEGHGRDLGAVPHHGCGFGWQAGTGEGSAVAPESVIGSPLGLTFWVTKT